MQKLQKIDDFLFVVFNVMIILTSVFMTGLVFFLVLSRYFFGSSMIGTLEMATICALWLYMLGCMVASRNNEHLTVDFLEQSIVRPKLKAYYEISKSIIVFGISLFVLYLASEMLAWALKRPQTTPALGIPLLWQQASMLIATVFFVTYGFRDVIRAFGLLKTNEGSE
ncbi:TRAP transporter small permease [Epibacterium ulvae]|uniref:TRAP transporter small permease protein n=1 Tax=Epibacterium ulvae TaxID=1156985 RepID=A0A1G5QVA3_9RHOB|nr:TRAP transporter small permease subunit [Epibacterium ulvae]SCZ65596.1 TRAP-type C4-dicarboxylate transport system, small permease component [Epibacterium ulvae]